MREWRVLLKSGVHSVFYGDNPLSDLQLQRGRVHAVCSRLFHRKLWFRLSALQQLDRELFDLFTGRVDLHLLLRRRCSVFRWECVQLSLSAVLSVSVNGGLNLFMPEVNRFDEKQLL